MPGKRIERLQIMLSEEELAAIDEWRFRHRMPSRSAAVRAMLNVAIRKEPHAEEFRHGEVAASKEVGVLAAPLNSGETAAVRRRRTVVIEPARAAAASIAILLEQAGHDVIGVLTGPRDWNNTPFKKMPDCAVIGDGLDPAAASQMADELTRHGVPFLYVKARPDEPVPDRFQDIPVIPAEVKPEDFNTFLERVCGP